MLKTTLKAKAWIFEAKALILVLGLRTYGLDLGLEGPGLKLRVEALALALALDVGIDYITTLISHCCLTTPIISHVCISSYYVLQILGVVTNTVVLFRY